LVFGFRARLPGKAAGQGCRARLPGKAAGQGCRARLPGKSAGQGFRARLPGNVTCMNKKKKNNNKAKLRPALYVRTNAGKNVVTLPPKFVLGGAEIFQKIFFLTIFSCLFWAIWWNFLGIFGTLGTLGPASPRGRGRGASSGGQILKH
jgi:hypothetical protein